MKGDTAKREHLAMMISRLDWERLRKQCEKWGVSAKGSHSVVVNRLTDKLLGL